MTIPALKSIRTNRTIPRRSRSDVLIGVIMGDFHSTRPDVKNHAFAQNLGD
jgi:hypothetical protein